MTPLPAAADEYAKARTQKHQPLPDPGKCVDLDERCKEWAAAGECTKNPGGMQTRTALFKCAIAWVCASACMDVYTCVYTPVICGMLWQKLVWGS